RRHQELGRWARGAPRRARVVHHREEHHLQVPRVRKQIMEYREFGDTGWKVSQIAIGTMQIGGGWGDTNDEDGIATVRAALDAGINFIDTADMYGFGKSE